MTGKVASEDCVPKPTPCAGAAARAKRVNATPPSPTATGYIASSTAPWRHDCTNTYQPAAPIKPEPVRAATGRMSANTPIGATFSTQPTMTSMVCSNRPEQFDERRALRPRHAREGETENEREEHERDHRVAGGCRDRVRRQKVCELFRQPWDCGCGPAVDGEQGVRAHRVRPATANKRRCAASAVAAATAASQRDEQSERERRRPAGCCGAARIRDARR